MTRRTSTLTIVTFRVVEETDEREPPPSLPPFPLDVETTGEDITETTAPRGIAKCAPLLRLVRSA
jgi:hypothetical protein